MAAYDWPAIGTLDTANNSIQHPPGLCDIETLNQYTELFPRENFPDLGETFRFDNYNQADIKLPPTMSRTASFDFVSASSEYSTELDLSDQANKIRASKSERRREQNRRAQRAYKERKECHQKMLENEIEALQSINTYISQDLDKQSRRVKELEDLVKRLMHQLVSLQISTADKLPWPASTEFNSFENYTIRNS